MEILKIYEGISFTDLQDATNTLPLYMYEVYFDNRIFYFWYYCLWSEGIVHNLYSKEIHPYPSNKISVTYRDSFVVREFNEILQNFKAGKIQNSNLIKNIKQYEVIEI